MSKRVKNSGYSCQIISLYFVLSDSQFFGDFIKIDGRSIEIINLCFFSGFIIRQHKVITDNIINVGSFDCYFLFNLVHDIREKIAD